MSLPWKFFKGYTITQAHYIALKLPLDTMCAPLCPMSLCPYVSMSLCHDVKLIIICLPSPPSPSRACLLQIICSTLMGSRSHCLWALCTHTRLKEHPATTSSWCARLMEECSGHAKGALSSNILFYNILYVSLFKNMACSVAKVYSQIKMNRLAVCQS